tara:strand:+ start:53 stop:205 length:153 start_codon:yes stop_codon:yes gene_type:complete
MTAAVFVSDISCMIAAIYSWHERHERGVAEVERRFGQEDVSFFVAGKSQD